MSAQNSYETMLIFSLTKGDEGTAELVEKFKALIEANGTLDSVEEGASAGSRTLSTMRPRVTIFSSTTPARLSFQRNSTGF